jgi:hypothetical protein
MVIESSTYINVENIDSYNLNQGYQYWTRKPSLDIENPFCNYNHPLSLGMLQDDSLATMR